jgi:hypothetical protein
MSDPYVLPNGVLRNRLGITDAAALATAEADITRAHGDAPTRTGCTRDVGTGTRRAALRRSLRGRVSGFALLASNPVLV